MFATRKILIQLLMQRIIRHACIYNGRMTSLVYHYVLYPWKPVTGGYLHACVGACVGACYAYILYVCMQQLSFRFAYMQCTSVQRQSWHRIWYSQRSKQPNRCRRILLRGLLNAIPHGLPARYLPHAQLPTISQVVQDAIDLQKRHYTSGASDDPASHLTYIRTVSVTEHASKARSRP